MREEELKKDEKPVEGTEPLGMVPVEGKDEPEGSKDEDGVEGDGKDKDPLPGGGQIGPIKK